METLIVFIGLLVVVLFVSLAIHFFDAKWRKEALHRIGSLVQSNEILNASIRDVGEQSAERLRARDQCLVTISDLKKQLQAEILKNNPDAFGPAMQISCVQECIQPVLGHTTTTTRVALHEEDIKKILIDYVKLKHDAGSHNVLIEPLAGMTGYVITATKIIKEQV